MKNYFNKKNILTKFLSIAVIIIASLYALFGLSLVVKGFFGCIGIEKLKAPNSIYTSRFGKDNNSIYALTWDEFFCKKQVLQGVDYNTFTVLDEKFAKDKNKVYYNESSGGIILVKYISEADPNTFRVLMYGYAKDDKNAYFGDAVIRNADVETFTIVKTHTYLAKDKNFVYENGKVLSGENPNLY